MLRLSLREMLALVAAVALVIVSMLNASPLWQSIVGVIAMLVVFAMLIAAIFDRGSRQVFAIAFAVVTLGYAVMVMNGAKRQAPSGMMHNAELYGEPDAVLPTSVFLRWLDQRLEQTNYVYTDTDEKVPASEESNINQPGIGMPSIAGRTVTWQQLPPLDNFAPTGHYWWALLFGYVAARYAQFVYTRRIRQQPAAG
jgi:hypothetical protein